MTGISSVISDAPEVAVTNARPLEKDLYKKVWDMPEYRKDAPGEKVAHEFLAQAKPKAGAQCFRFRLWHRTRWIKPSVFWWIRCDFG